ncbi:hypothetical protein PVAND_011710 [Polypedilum vanderplanki]|uniref:Uncharacterized protein n=1 Tax=Polypedilum vanderplanki TaxID=319348 RepID=A0A9J6CJG4_POLVA|nr:hypothetical protein PVAND_011710 [Polypedilum vanderplanki]
MSKNQAGDEDINDCPELDDDYFTEIGQSFTVLDVWADNEEEVIVKKEPRDSSEQTSTKRSSKRSNSRSDDRKNKSKSPERNRSRSKRATSPYRRLSNDRRRSPMHSRKERNRIDAKKSFLMELQEKFQSQGKEAPEIENLIRQQNLNVHDYKNRQHNFSNNNDHQAKSINFMNNSQMMLQQQQFNPIMLNPMMNMNMQQHQPVMMNPYMQSNSFIPFDPMIVQQNLQIPIPQPVPPPTQQFDLPSLSNDLGTFESTSSRELNIEEVKKKALEQKKINLTDFLRQKSKQKNKSESYDGNSFAKKSEVLKRCKLAANSISEIERQEKSFPIKCVMTNEIMPTIATKKEFLNKSPLITNDENLLFKFQAINTLQFRKALINNPIRNISGSMISFAQNMKMDLSKLSLKVDKEAKTFPLDEGEQLQAQSHVQLNQVVATNRKIMSKGIQTEVYNCEKCYKNKQIRSNAKSKSVQTMSTDLNKDIGIQCDDDLDNFTFTIDKKTLENKTYEQHYALQVFVEAFKIPCKFLDLDTKNIESNAETKVTQPRFRDDERLNFANPENPNSNRMDFISLSPIHKTSRSISPRKIPIFDRIGEKISDPMYVDDDEDSRSSLNLNKTNRYRKSPPFSNRHRFDHGRNLSPGPSKRFRNRSRSKSRSRDSFSPLQQRRRYDLNERKGRY